MILKINFLSLFSCPSIVLQYFLLSTPKFTFFLNCWSEISLVVQWLRIRLPIQGTRVRSLVRQLRSHMPQGNLSLHTASTEPVCSGAHAPQLESPYAATPEPVSSRARTLQQRACMPQQKIPHAATKIPWATTKTQSSQINK